MALETCCCGCSLRTGTLIIAILAIISSIVGCATSLYTLINSYNNWTSGLAAGPAEITVFALLVGCIIAGVLLLIAVLKNKPMFLLPWLSLFALGIFITPIHLIYSAVILTTIGYLIPLALVFGVGIPVLGLGIYLWMVVFSYYKETNKVSLIPTPNVSYGNI